MPFFLDKNKILLKLRKKENKVERRVLQPQLIQIVLNNQLEIQFLLLLDKTMKTLQIF